MMGVSAVLLGLWSKTAFRTRILAGVAASLLAAGAAMAAVSIYGEAAAAREELREELQAEILTLPDALAETVVLGDYAQLKQVLERRVALPRMDRATFRDEAGAVVEAVDTKTPKEAPDWFKALAGLEDVSGEAPIVVGGRTYGALSIAMESQEDANRLWARLRLHAAILFAGSLVSVLAIQALLGAGLRPLRRLEEASAALADGRADVRIEGIGPPELRKAIEAFNRMSESLGAARRELLAKNRDLVRFSEISAHHLQEPARRLHTCVQLLQSARTHGDVQAEEEAMGFIKSESARLRALLRDMERHVSADVPSGPMEGQDVAAAVEAAAETLFQEIYRRASKVEVADGIPPVLLDRRRLQGIFREAIENSLAFKRPGGPARIRVSGRKAEREGFVEIRIEDEGMGVEEEYRERAFRIFERLGADGDPDRTGIGLPWIRRVAESVGGSAAFESGGPDGIVLVVVLPEKEPS